MDFPSGRLNLYLTEIGEPTDNELRLVVWEASPGGETVFDASPLRVTNVHPLEVTNYTRIFEIMWRQYVAYSVRNESYWWREEGEPKFSSHLYRRSESAFLQYVSATTFANDEYPGPLQHWALTTLHHCVDVVTNEPPQLRLLSPEEAGRRPTSLVFVKG